MQDITEWKVTYRAKDGTRTTNIFSAANRNELFKVLELRGLRAIRVEDCPNKKNCSAHLSKSVLSCKALVCICFATGIIIAALVILTWRSNQREDGELYNKPPREIAKSQVTLRKGNNTKAPIDTSVVSSNATKELTIDTTLLEEKIVEVISVVTNADGAVIERFKTADGKIRSKQSAPRPIFDNPSDQIIALAVSGAATGAEMPPIPLLEDADGAFAKSLETEIEIKESDSEDINELKKNVIAVREEIRQLLSEGHSFADIIKDHRELVNKGVAIKEEASRLAKELLDEGDREAAAEFLIRANETLRDMGVDEIEMPLSQEEKRALIRERKNNK